MALNRCATGICIAWHRIAIRAPPTTWFGTATGEAHGRSFHWTWTLATSPGNPLLNVTMDQWMYLMDDGAMVNRTTIRKLDIIVAEVTEQFDRVP